MSQAQHIHQNIERHIQFLPIANPEATEAGDRVLEFMSRTPAPCSRQTEEGHITCSAFVVDQGFTKAALIKHAQLERWLQPGGHMEAGEYPAEAAVREAIEETGLTGVQLWAPGLIDIDIHTIPANPRKGEPEHSHYDLRYLCVAVNEELAPDMTETTGSAWLSFEDILADPSMPESIKRMVRITERLMKRPGVAGDSTCGRVSWGGPD